MHKFSNSSPTANSPTSTTPKRRPPLALLKRGTSVIPSPEVNSASSSRESAFSFHQNPRTSLLFGKNNVFAFDGDKEKPGYLSLLQDLNRLLVLKWTPNALLHSEPSTNRSPRKMSTHVTSISVRMETITHLHLHQNEQTKPICIVLIDSDGIEQFACKFTLKQHCLSFLNSLDAGLSPLFRINPSLNSIKFDEFFLANGINANCLDNSTTAGSNLMNALNSAEDPKLVQQHSSTNAANRMGLVFRIVSFASFSSSQSQKTQKSSRTISRASTQDSRGGEDLTDSALRDSLANATRAMRNQILGRAFYGWLSYCRHMRTIRNNLATIVTPAEDFPLGPDDAEMPVNEVFWRLCRSEKTIPLYKQFLTRVYFHGVDHDLRIHVWPYLLRVVEWHEDLGMDKLAAIKKAYERDTAEWMEIERELAQREKETVSQDLTRQDSEIANDFGFKDFPPAYSGSVCSDVFEDGSNSTNVSPDSKEHQQGEQTMFDKEFGVNLIRIQKDVDRTDRNTKFYSKIQNLESLRKVMCTYVYRQLKLDLYEGYVQGMCDLLAPLLVIFGDEALTLAAFEQLMRRMAKNFPQSKQAGGIEDSLNYFRCLVEVMDPELYAQLMRNVDYSFVVFYRWLLLDFKRELLYCEVWKLWEVVWAADVMFSRHFALFFGLALLTQYREILIENEMDFTDVIKFFNEMSEKHDVHELLDIARKKLRTFQETLQDLNRTNC